VLVKIFPFSRVCTQSSGGKPKRTFSSLPSSGEHSWKSLGGVLNAENFSSQYCVKIRRLISLGSDFACEMVKK
jgi:hypothetical protein